jgi:signal transduction histidine kinase
MHRLHLLAVSTHSSGQSVDELLQGIAELLPAGCRYPLSTVSRITLDGRAYSTPAFQGSNWKLSSDIAVDGVHRGCIEVFYTGEPSGAVGGPFTKGERDMIDAVALTLGIALAYHGSQWELRERRKELTCLHAIAEVAQRPGLSLTRLLREIASLLPPALQYPEAAQARITIDGQSVTSQGFLETGDRLVADVFYGGERHGSVEVAYAAVRPSADEGPFLKEERSLINEVARQVGMILERMDADNEKARLQEQLRHADRLATIGQLAAGAAHELNEPLGSILGFAQLAKNSASLPIQAEQDIERIVNAALHAREVVKKLMIFARQMPTRKILCNLNNLVGEGLYFLEARCTREGIRLERQLEEGLPEISADASQLHQVIVNLVVNAIQAMPHGGALTIKTRAEGDQVELTVEDSGTGMTEDVMKQLFTPFFTTKGIGHGTGLGLPVVHGIVSSHGGAIQVTSHPGRGSRFVVTLPIPDVSSSKENL